MTESRDVDAAYVRVSTAEQAGGTSPQTQRERIAAYAASELRDVVEYYADEGYSGKTVDRPALRRMLNDAEAGRFTRILITEPDRLSRDLMDGLLVERQLLNVGVSVLYLSNPTMGTLERQIKGAFAEDERRQIAARTYRGLRSVARSGHWPGGPAPYGYRIDRSTGKRSTLVVYEPEADVIRKIVTMLVDQRLTCWQIASELNADGVPSPSASSIDKSPPRDGGELERRVAPRWNHRNLRGLLKNAEGISGSWSYRRGSRSKAFVNDDPEIVINIPPIISPERHAALRAALDRTSAGPGSTARKNSYLLVGRIYSACGSGMHGSTRPGTDKRVYRCYSSRAETGPDRCECRRCHAGALEAAVWGEVHRVLTEPERLMTLAEEGLNKERLSIPLAANDLGAIDRSIAKIEKAMGQTVADLARRGMEPQVIEEATATLDADLRRLCEHRDRAIAWAATSEERTSRLGRLKELAATAESILANPSPEVKARVLGLLNAKVTVTGWEVCPECNGRGLLPSDAAPGSSGRGATGVVCPRCHRHKHLPIVEITGTVPDAISFDPQGMTNTSDGYPFGVVASAGAGC